MANINDSFPSKYLKAADLEVDDGETIPVTISDIQFEEVGKDKDMRPILYYEGEDKGIVLNKTNATNISKLYGSETDDWIGKKVLLGTAWVDFQGQSVEAIRIYPPKQRAAGKPSVNRPLERASAPDERNPPPRDLDDEIPF